MQFITSLIGGSGNWLTAVFALGIVIVLIVLAVWLLKLLFKASGNVGRGRNRRLTVVDTLALDPKRQLLIIRRDNVEHLILTGGPQDVVVETGIPVQEAPAAQPARRPIPIVAARKPAHAPAHAPAHPPAHAHTPAPAQRPVGAPPAAAIAAPPAAPEPVLPGSALEKLREQGRPTNKRAHLSLRHTGLLRPISEMEMAVSPENSATPASRPIDSAKEDHAQREIEGTDLVEGNTEANRN